MLKTYNYKFIHTNSYTEIYMYETTISAEGKKSASRLSKEENKKSEKEQERINLKRMQKTRKQAKADLVRLIDTNFCNNTSFITLTCKENITDRKEFNNMFHKFITRMNYHFLSTKKRELKYIAVLEQQERGAFHIHMLVFDIKYLPYEKLQKVWGHGFVWINKVSHLDSVSNVGRYVAKYMEKGLGQELLENKHKKSFYASNNLRKPVISKVYLEDDNLDSFLEDREIVYESEYLQKHFVNGEFIDSKVIYKKIKK